jgi:hypothetical protein
MVRIDAHWKTAAKQHRVRDMDDAYDDDDIRAEAESAMLSEALDHWDDRVTWALRRARRTGRASK